MLNVAVTEEKHSYFGAIEKNVEKPSITLFLLPSAS